eukprot:2325669-Prymnesium_polylepis.1
MSTSLERGPAIDYAGGGDGVVGILLEMELGMTSRGADLEWISQYPGEKEVLLPPLTALEVVGTRVEGSLLVVSMQPTINNSNQPIEQVVAKMKTSCLQLVRTLKQDLIFHGAPRPAVRALARLEQTASARDPSWYNTPSHFLQATMEAMKAEETAFREVLQPKVWSFERQVSSRSISDRMIHVGELAARLEQHSTAMDLVKMA